MTIDPRFERSVHRWLRAYPRRWRAQRSDELVAVVADLAAPGATRVDLRTAAGLVRAGWATRARSRPPLWHWLGYQLVDRRVPARYRGWVRDDIEGPWYPLRQLIPVIWVVVAVSTLVPLTFGERPHLPSLSSVPVLLAMTVGILARGSSGRRKRARKHLVPDEGEELTADTLLFGWVPRDRLAARGVTGLLVSAVAVVAVAACTAYLVAPTGVAVQACGEGCTETVSVDRDDPALAVLGVALLAGGLVALRARRHLRRLVSARPAQPARRLVPPTMQHRLLTSALVVCVLGVAWIEGTGRTDLFLVVAIAVVSLLALPATFVAWWVARTGPDDLALVDVLTISAKGRAPGVDTYCEGLVPALVSTD